MKNKILILFLVTACFTSFAPSFAWARDNIEVIFSETFEGDLSRWESQGDEQGKKINLVEYKNEDDPEEEEYLSSVLRIDQKEDIKMTTLKSPVIDVEPGGKYTFAVDMKGSGNQIAYIIYVNV